MTSPFHEGTDHHEADSVEFQRVSTGNEQADAILCGGFPANSVNIVMGQPGTGKTIFAE